MRLLVPLIIILILLYPSYSSFGIIETSKSPYHVPVIRASNYYELGYRQGKMFLHSYKRLIIISSIISRVKGFDREAREHIDVLKRHYPEFLERLKGLSDAIGVSLLKVVSADLALSSISSGCTITGVSPNVTRDGQRYLSWNLDLNYLYKILFSRYVRPPPIVICSISGRYRYVEVNSLPSIFGFGLLNEKGLACVYSTVFSDEVGDGLTSLELNHLAMERCSNIDEVRDVFENSERESGRRNVYTAFGLTANLNSIWSDRYGRQMIVEYDHSNIIFKYGDILVETNHYQYLKENREIPNYYMISSRMRLNRAYQLLRENTGMIDEHFYTERLLVDHGNFLKRGDAFDICRHGLTYGTVVSMLIEPDRYVVLYSPGHPCRVGFRYIDLRELVE